MSTLQAARERGPEIAAEIDRVTPVGGSYFVWGTVESAQAYAESRHFSNVIWSHFDLGRPGGAILLGRRFPSQGDILLRALEEGPLPTTIVVTAPVAGFDADPPSGQGGSSLHVADDPRVEPELLRLLESRYRVLLRAPDHTVLISAR